MPQTPVGFAPPVPGLTASQGVTPNSASPMSMLAMMLGQKSPPPDTTQEKMSQIVQMLREVSKSDPRIGMIASEALRVLLEGPPGGPGASQPPGAGGGPMMGGPSAGGGMPPGMPPGMLPGM